MQMQTENTESVQNHFKKECKVHKNQLIMGICLNTECSSATRLVCFECLVNQGSHSAHTQSVVALSQLHLNGKCSGNWPQGQEGEDTKLFLQNLKNVKSSEDIDNQFDAFNERLTSEVNIARNKVKQFFQDQYAITAKFTANLEKHFDNVYSLERIVLLLTEYDKGTISDSELQVNIASFLKSDEKQSSLEALRKVVLEQQNIQLFAFERKQFDSCAEKCIECIKSFANTYKASVNPIKFIVAPVKNPDSVVFTQNGNLTSWSHASHSVVYTKELICQGKTKVRVRLDTHTSGCYVVGIERDSQKETSQYWAASIPACCITCKSQDAISMATTTPGTFVGNYLSPGKILDIEINPQVNLFTVGVEGTETKFKLESFNLQQWEPFRLFFNNYSGQPSSFTLISSQVESS